MHVAVDSVERLVVCGCEHLAHRRLATPCLTNQQHWLLELKRFAWNNNIRYFNPFIHSFINPVDQDTLI
jgi:hypothetical protein